jgi:hypothetical protein
MIIKTDNTLGNRRRKIMLYAVPHLPSKVQWARLQYQTYPHEKYTLNVRGNLSDSGETITKKQMTVLINYQLHV